MDIEWNLEVFPGQPMALNGTIQEAVAQAVQINPEYKTVNDSNAARDVGKLQKRKYTNWDGRPNCNPDPTWGWANWDWIHNGAQYLDNIHDGSRPGEGPGPGKCGRVSCAWSSAIYWCNDVSSFNFRRFLSGL